jgi:hypothetical protein
MDLLPDLPIPGVATTKFTLVEPDFDTGGAECLANPLGRPRVLRGVAKEYSARRLTYRQNDPLILLTARALGTPESATWLCPVNVTPCSNAAVKSLLTV